MPKRVFSVADAALELGVSVHHVYILIWRKKLPASVESLNAAGNVIYRELAPGIEPTDHLRSEMSHKLGQKLQRLEKVS